MGVVLASPNWISKKGVFTKPSPSGLIVLAITPLPNFTRHCGEVTNRMYNYEALQTPQDIQVLILDSGQPLDEVRCSLERTFLPDHPDFEALSYV